MDLIIGAIDNYSLAQIKPWCLSIKKSGFNGSVVLITYRVTQDILDFCNNEGIVTYQCEYTEAMGSMFAHVTRFYHAWQLMERLEQQFRYAMILDVSDIIVQKNPSVWLENNLAPYKIVAPSEGILFKDEEWNADTMKKSYGIEVYELKMKNTKCINVGTIAGEFEFMKNFCLSLFHIAKGAMHYPADQTGANIMFHGLLKDVTKFVSQEDIWAVNAGTCLDETKSWLFERNCDKLPIIVNNIAQNYNGEDVVLFHQWPRTSAATYIRNKYV